MLLVSACGFAEALVPEKGGAVAGANSDNYRLPNQAGSEQDARKACPDMDRMPQNPARAHHRGTSRPEIPMDTGNAQMEMGSFHYGLGWL
jgi:hypothetical protein